MSVRPKFITVEGGEGVGKTTQLKVIQTCLEAAGMSVCMTREPGGTPLGERLRDTLLAPEPSLTPTPMAELLLMFAARAQHVTTIIEPALQRGEWVLCDRFSDASFAYQGYGRGLPVATVEMLERLTHPALTPDLTILLDVDPKVGLERARERGDLDRFEVEASAFFKRVREGYLLRARHEPERWRIIDAGRSLPEVEAQIRGVLTDWLEGDENV